MSKYVKKSKYRSLTCNVTSTIPRHSSFRETWIHPSTPPRPSRHISFVENVYCSRENMSVEDLKAMKGQVERWKKYFSAQPLAAAPNEENNKPKPQKDNPVKVITYRPSKTAYPKPVPRRTKTIDGKDLICCSLGRQHADQYLRNCQHTIEDSKIPSNIKENKTRKTPRRYTDIVAPTILNAVQIYEGKRNHCESQDKNIKNSSMFDSESHCRQMNQTLNTTENESLATPVPDLAHNKNQNKRVPEFPDFSCRSDATEKGCRVAEGRAEVVSEILSTQRRPVAGDVGGMSGVVEKRSPVPRVVAASVKSYKDIPEELFDSLPESSVDPSPNDRNANSSRHSEWRNMREGRRALLFHDDVLDDYDGYRYPSLIESNSTDSKTQNAISNNIMHKDSLIPRNPLRGFYDELMGGSKEASFHIPPPPPVKYSKFPPSPPVPTREHPPDYEREYFNELDRDLQMAGIYFRKPEEHYSYIADDTDGDVHNALATLDASLEGFYSDGDASSGESSPARSYASSVIERDSQFYSGSHNKNVKSVSSALETSETANDSEARNESRKFIQKGFNQYSEKHSDEAKTVIRINGELRHSDLSVTKTSAKHGGPSRGRAMESLNLIEEVYVTSKTKPVPQSTVQMKAYYPSVNYSDGRAPSCTTVHVNIDSDSGHESGATSPCETLTGEEAVSPPPSPPTPKLPQSSLAYENHLRKNSRTSKDNGNINEVNLRPSIQYNESDEPFIQNGDIGVAVIQNAIEDDYVNVSVASISKTESTHFVVVAIDFGTTYSGYAFSFTNDPENIHMMKKWEGGDPGIQNQKTPTIVLLTPDEEFHSLGFTARDTYHDIDPTEAQNWLYFDKFKMELHSNQTLTRDSFLEATNGKKVSALKIFSYALQYFRDHALRELSEQIGADVEEDDVRWVITVPAIWSHPAKQFMRLAAYKALMGSPLKPDQLLIALEPEAAAIYCRRLRQNQLLQEKLPEMRLKRLSAASLGSPNSTVKNVQEYNSGNKMSAFSLPELDRGTVYMVVDCGGGTVDITVHQMTDRKSGHLKELHKATGGPYGSIGVDKEFEKLLDTMFDSQFMNLFKAQRSAAYVELMIAFEARKRNASPHKNFPLNISLPFAFIDFYKKTKGKEVDSAIKKHSGLGVKWSSQGMLRIEQETMKRMFVNTLAKITMAIDSVLTCPEVGSIQYMFLVGGFAESELLQKHIRDSFETKVNVIIPQGMGLAILLGAVQFGLDPSVVTVRRSRLTYGVGVLNKYDEKIHPQDKKVVAAGSVWCADILDKFVEVDESVAIGDVVTRSYTPATPSQKSVILHLYATECHGVKYVTDNGVRRVGTLYLELANPTPKVPPRKPIHNTNSPQDNNNTTAPQISPKRRSKREITVHLKFGGTEVKASAVDHLTGTCVKANIEFTAL